MAWRSFRASAPRSGSTFGYLLALQLIARLKPQSPSRSRYLPFIAVIVPVLNEERLIRDKLDNLCASDYPADRLRIVVVDGGSADQTAPLVALAIREACWSSSRNWSASGRRRRSTTRSHSWTEIVVVTDADARPSRVARANW
jgi:hyaluronan synthase